MPIYNVQYKEAKNVTPQQALMLVGALIKVEISVPNKIASVLTENKRKIPNPFTGRALLDTGASKTCVDDAILKKLRLPPVSRVNVCTPSGTAQQLAYPVKLDFPGSPIPTIEFNSVLGSKLRNQNIDVLIGRDILCQCLFIINGVQGNFSLAF